jgi:hypothetical protein
MPAVGGGSPIGLPLPPLLRLDKGPRRAPIFWAKDEKRILDWHWQGHMRVDLAEFAALRRIREVRKRRYDEVEQATGVRMRIPHPTRKDGEGVIYAVYHRYSRMIYIGQTVGTAIERFKQHVRSSLKWLENRTERDGYPLARAMAKHGWQNFGVTTLEKVDGLYAHTKNGTKQFRTAATPLENYWIRRMHSTTQVRGYNGTHGGTIYYRAKRHRHPSRNPLMYKRRRGYVLPPPPAIAAAVAPVAVNGLTTQCEDSRRRIKHLGHQLTTHGYEAAKQKVKTYSRRTLQRVRYPLANWAAAVLQLSERRRRQLLALVTARLKTEVDPVDRQRSKLVILPYAAHAMQHIGIEGIVRKQAVRQLYPQGLGPKTLACWKFGVTLAQKVCNYRQAGEEIKWDTFDDNAPCECHLHPTFVDASCGHVLTLDIDIVQDVTLRHLLKKGSKFRTEFVEVEQPADTMEIAGKCLDSHIKKEADKEKIPEAAYDAWKDMVLGAIEERIKVYPVHIPEKDDTMKASRKDFNRKIKKLQESFVFTLMDKNPNNFVVICKKFYQSTLIKEMSANGTYQVVAAESEEDISARHQTFQKNNCELKAYGGTLPYSYWTGKMHKDPPSWRMISAASVGTSMQTMSKWISRGLKEVLRCCDRLFVQVVEDAGVPCTGSWVLKDTDGFVEMLREVKSTGLSKDEAYFRVYDFKTLYTSIPLADLKTRLTALIAQIFQVQADKGLNVLVVSEDGSKWAEDRTHNKNTKYVRLFDAAELTKWVTYLIDNIYTKVGDRIFWQRIGIPMGTNCAPELADLYLFSYEFSFVRQLIQQGALALLQKFSRTVRYLDDCASVGNNDFERYLHRTTAAGLHNGIYPDELAITVSCEGSNIDYLDVSTRWTGDDKLFTKVFDKREGDVFHGLTLIKYPEPDTKLSQQAIYGVINSQLGRFSRRCLRRKEFLSTTLDFLRFLRGKGYNMVTVTRKASRFFSRQDFMYGAAGRVTFKALTRLAETQGLL